MQLTEVINLLRKKIYNINHKTAAQFQLAVVALTVSLDCLGIYSLLNRDKLFDV